MIYNAFIFSLRKHVKINSTSIIMSNITNKGHLSYIPKKPANIEFKQISQIELINGLTGKGKSGILFLNKFIRIKSSSKTYLCRIYDTKGFVSALQKVGIDNKITIK